MTHDKEQLQALVRDFSKAFNGKNAKNLAALFTADAEFINIFGMRMMGRTGIESGHAHFFGGLLKGAEAEFNVVETRFPRPDIAINIVNWSRGALPDAGAGTLPPGKGTMTMVAAKDGGQWFFVAAHNTAASTQPVAPKSL